MTTSFRSQRKRESFDNVDWSSVHKHDYNAKKFERKFEQMYLASEASCFIKSRINSTHRDVENANTELIT